MLSEELNRKIAELVDLKKEICGSFDANEGLLLAESKVQQWLNTLGDVFLQEIINEIPEPVTENTIQVDNTVLKYQHTVKRILTNRFGGETVLTRRIYREHDGEKFVKGGHHFSPLEEKLGIDPLGGYTPGLAYIITLCGAIDAYVPSAKLISELLEITVGSTGVQKTTERVGLSLSTEAQDLIPPEAQSTECELICVSADATGSPRISDEPCKETGRQSLSNPTIAKMCTVIQYEKFQQPLTKRNSFKDDAPKADKVYTLASFADESFDEVRDLIRKGALLAGRNRAKLKVFKGDGQASNWIIHQDFFSDFIAILDPCHAMEHLTSFVRIVDNIPDGKPLSKLYYSFHDRILIGDILAVSEEMKELAGRLSGERKVRAEKEVSYMVKNRDKMLYDVYLELGVPIGSGNIESACKRVISHRFKKQGMRWRKDDNQAVLNARLHVLNGSLKQQFLSQVKCTWKLKVVA